MATRATTTMRWIVLTSGKSVSVSHPVYFSVMNGLFCSLDRKSTVCQMVQLKTLFSHLAIGFLVA